MNNVPKALTGLAVLAFVLAVVTAFTGPMPGNLQPESFSRACTNLALLAIAWPLAFGEKTWVR